MKNVTMLCAAGTSTHIFAVKVQEVLDEQNAPVRVNAWSVAQAKEQGVDSELILLTPQVQFEAELVRALFPDKRVEVIDFNAFAAMWWLPRSRRLWACNVPGLEGPPAVSVRGSFSAPICGAFAHVGVLLVLMGDALVPVAVLDTMTC